ncbi:hypothetical protein [Clostridium saccharoperbutylacetonicum]|nr:hypothetical protein [Clostridium saccharoperbutylacetonicum]NSB30057.1 hypothetical protein [Clostridium saccharoperbutylacetonicum]
MVTYIENTAISVNCSKVTFITKDGVVVVRNYGKLIIGWGKANFDENM